MAAPKSNIEFLPQEDWEKGKLGRFLKWALTAGRYIVVATELVAILAWLSRFKFDRNLTDLNEKIKSQQAIIQASSSFEQQFRFLQKQLIIISNLEKNRLQANEILTKIQAALPIDVYLSDLAFNDQKVNLTATALSEKGLATLLNNLKKSPSFNQISLVNVSQNQSKKIGINFQLTTQLTKKQ